MANKDYFMKTAGKILRLLLWIFLSFLLLIALVFLLLQTQWGNNLLRQGAQSYLQKKFKTEFTIGGFELDGLQKVGLYNVILRDQHKDTLLAFVLAVLQSGWMVKKIGINSAYQRRPISIARKKIRLFQFILDAL
jgi:autotransporter translocation and assembly factor TamB